MTLDESVEILSSNTELKTSETTKSADNPVDNKEEIIETANKPENPENENLEPKPSIQIISAQKWLETKYPQKEGVEKIEFREKDQYKLVGKLEIKDFHQLKIIDISENEGITELNIEVCSRIEEIDYSNVDLPWSKKELERFNFEKLKMVKGTEWLPFLRKLKFFKEEGLGSHFNYVVLIEKRGEMYENLFSRAIKDLEKNKEEKEEYEKLAEKALEVIKKLQKNEENSEKLEKRRLGIIFQWINILLSSEVKEEDYENKSAEELHDLIESKIKDLKEKLSPSHQKDVLNACKEKVKVQAQKTNASQLISKVDNINDYPQLVDIQSQVVETIESKQITAERRLKISLVAFTLYIFFSTCLLGTKSSKKKRGKIKKMLKKKVLS